MPDLEERLARHYTDVATAPRLDRRPSAAPRLVFAGLMVAILAGLVAIVVPGSGDDDLIIDPAPAVGSDVVDPEVVRLLERTPLYSPQTSIAYANLDNITAFGDMIEYNDGVFAPQFLFQAPFRIPDDQDWLMVEPDAGEQAFGFRFDDIERTLRIDFPWSGESLTGFNIYQLDRDPADVLDRAQTDPDWAADANRRTDGSFDIIDWGDEVNVMRRTVGRPVGIGGQLAGFDGDLVARSRSSASLRTLVATDDGAPTLTDDDQFMAAMEMIDTSGSLGFHATYTPGGRVDFSPDLTVEHPRVVVMEYRSDWSARFVVGFVDGEDLDAELARIASTMGEQFEPPVGPSVDVVSLERDGDFIVVEVRPTDTTSVWPPDSQRLYDGVVLNAFAHAG